MTQVTMEDGSKVETTLPPEAVADLQQPVEAPKEATPNAPEPSVKPAEPTAEDPKPEPAPSPEPAPTRTRKASPIANLLAKKNDLETELAVEKAARAELEAKLAAAAQQPASPTTTSDIKALAEKHGLDESILADIVAAARAGFPAPQLPKEVADLLHEREQAKQAEAETAAFNTRVDSLARTLADDQLKDPAVRDKLLKLAYSTDKAPDGEPYYQKELAELYFGFIKPEIEPGKPSAEPSRGGTKGGTQVLDFQDILDRDDPKDIDNMDGPTFTKYSSWLKAKQGLPPIKRGSSS